MRRRIRIGQPLPGANRAYSAHEKWTGWILSPEGHGDDWQHVFRAGPDHIQMLWREIAHGVLRAPVTTVRDRGRHGTVCGVALRITINARTAVVMTAWHYGPTSSVPRLVTAYPV